MKQRRIYYRRKVDKIIIEGKDKDGRSIPIWTLPDPYDLIEGICMKASFFTQEKSNKIMEKVRRLAIKEDKAKDISPKVPLIVINRTAEKDALFEETIKITKDIDIIRKAIDNVLDPSIKPVKTLTEEEKKKIEGLIK